MGLRPVPSEETLEIETKLKRVVCARWEIASDWGRGQIPLVRWAGQWLDLVKLSATDAEVG